VAGFAFVEILRPLAADALESARQLGLDQQVVGLVVVAVLEKDTFGIGEALEILTVAERASLRERDGESLSGQAGGWSEQVRPWFLAILAMGEFQALDCSGNAGGAVTGDTVLGGLALAIQIHIARGGCGGALAEVEERSAAVGEAGEQESAAT
jgi:hypothetical protein